MYVVGTDTLQIFMHQSEACLDHVFTCRYDCNYWRLRLGYRDTRRMWGKSIMYRVSGEVQRDCPEISVVRSWLHIALFLINQTVGIVTCYLSVRHFPFWMPRVGTSPPNVVKRIENCTKVQIVVQSSSTLSKEFSSCSGKKNTAASLLRIMAVCHRCLSIGRPELGEISLDPPSKVSNGAVSTPFLNFGSLRSMSAWTTTIHMAFFNELDIMHSCCQPTQTMWAGYWWPCRSLLHDCINPSSCTSYDQQRSILI